MLYINMSLIISGFIRTDIEVIAKRDNKRLPQGVKL
jgi:hypothetical protein